MFIYLLLRKEKKIELRKLNKYSNISGFFLKKFGYKILIINIS